MACFQLITNTQNQLESAKEDTLLSLFLICYRIPALCQGITQSVERSAEHVESGGWRRGVSSAVSTDQRKGCELTEQSREKDRRCIVENCQMGGSVYKNQLYTGLHQKGLLHCAQDVNPLVQAVHSGHLISCFHL
ncbi:hypothetical protein CEXT_378761 [Caerostris extrusa]|uniref:Uncharacterized protein n=1 Tax=Caerostris extrusa TaxID=172846 RepID=A0AAV4TSG6_CAEEX|nr:hypothetical protein CEXT_378761 [Caerostris extrusa]